MKDLDAISRSAMSWAALAAFAAAFMVFVGGYCIGKDLAGRDNIQQHVN